MENSKSNQQCYLQFTEEKELGQTLFHVEVDGILIKHFRQRIFDSFSMFLFDNKQETPRSLAEFILGAIKMLPLNIIFLCSGRNLINFQGGVSQDTLENPASVVLYAHTAPH